MDSATMSQISEPMTQNAKLALHIEAMQNLLHDILELPKENRTLDKEMEKVESIILESSNIVENSISASEMLIDAKILHAGSTVVNMNVSTLNTNLTVFNETKYVNGIHNYIENSDRAVVVGKEWECLAPVTYHIFKKSNPVTFMLGTFELEPEHSKKKKKLERPKKVPGSEKLSLTTAVPKEGDRPAKPAGDIYDHILKWLVRHYKKNDKKPISYFKFIVDPEDYWQSVENIFHFAFLVRDGSARMILTGEEPLIEPVIRSSDDKKASTSKQMPNNQFCFSLSKTEWSKCIHKFNIKKPCIPAFGTPSTN